MEQNTPHGEPQVETSHHETSHRELSSEQYISYLGSFPPIVQFSGLIIGVFMEFVFPTKMFPPHTAQMLGAIIVVLATLIIWWSQKTSAAFRLREKRGEARNFRKGPYRFSDNPTSFSLALLIVGFGCMLNSLMIVLLSIIGYWVSFIVYETKKRRIMLEKYKDDYADYKKKIKSLF